MENREKIKSDLPSGSAVTDISKKAGELWKELSGDDKKVGMFTVLSMISGHMAFHRFCQNV